jgi:hypothetical protein
MTILKTITAGVASLALAVGLVAPAFAADEATISFKVNLPNQAAVADFAGTITLEDEDGNSINASFTGSNESGLLALVGTDDGGGKLVTVVGSRANTSAGYYIRSDVNPNPSIPAYTVPVTFTATGLKAGTTYTVIGYTAFNVTFADGTTDPALDKVYLTAVNDPQVNSALGEDFKTEAAPVVPVELEPPVTGVGNSITGAVAALVAIVSVAALGTGLTIAKLRK